jgi:hypothetical protein
MGNFGEKGNLLATQALDAYIAGMKTHQYTIRGVPERVDLLLRAKARESKKSLNQTTLEALQMGLGEPIEKKRNHDLDFLIGTWVEDPAFDEAMKEFSRIDEEMWK